MYDLITAPAAVAATRALAGVWCAPSTRSATPASPTGCHRPTCCRSARERCWLVPSAVVELNRAVAVGMADGPAAAPSPWTPTALRHRG